MWRNYDGREKGDSLFFDVVKLMGQFTKPGEELNKMIRPMLKSLSTRLDATVDEEGVDLWEWASHALTMGMTDTTYGPKNPFNDPLVEKAFW